MMAKRLELSEDVKLASEASSITDAIAASRRSDPYSVSATEGIELAVHVGSVEHTC